MCLAVPGLILSVEGNGLERSGVVRFGQVERRVNLAFTPEAAVDDYVIVQEYLPQAIHGDTRLVLMNGYPLTDQAEACGSKRRP